MKQGLLDGLSALHLPENPLDQIVNHFGEKNVAERTGRTRRLIRDPHNGRVEYKKRAPEGVPMHRVNVDSTERFQGARCRVAIISDAGSIGISLHSSNRAQNRERRVHITLELGKLKTEGESKLHVIRVCTKDGQRIVGVEIPPKGVGKVLRSLGLGSSASDPQQVFTAVLHQGEQIDLTSNLRLKRSTLQREPAIELVCVDCDRFQELRELGLINEQIKFKQCFFVPTDEKKGLPILTKLLDRYPVMEPESAAEQQERESLPVIEGPEAAEFRMVDLEQWVLPPDMDVLLEAAFAEDSMPLAFIAAAVPSPLQEPPIQTGPSLITLLEQHSRSVEPRRGRKQRPQVEEQGLLFSLQ
jgi:hypothetical protein